MRRNGRKEARRRRIEEEEQQQQMYSEHSDKHWKRFAYQNVHKTAFEVHVY